MQDAMNCPVECLWPGGHVLVQISHVCVVTVAERAFRPPKLSLYQDES